MPIYLVLIYTMGYSLEERYFLTLNVFLELNGAILQCTNFCFSILYV